MNRIRLAIIVVALAVVMTLASGLALGGTAQATGSCAAVAQANTPPDGTALGGLAKSGPGALSGYVAGLLATCG